MTNAPRPDVAGIEARAEAEWRDQGRWQKAAEVEKFLTKDIPALADYIKSLEERMVKLEAVVEAARGIADHITKATFSELDDALAALDSPDEQKAMETGDG